MQKKKHTNADTKDKTMVDAIALLEEKGAELIVMLTKFCYNKIQDKSARCDIAQSTLLDLIAYKGSFESEKHIRNWLYKVALNKIKDYKQATYREFAADLAAATTNSSNYIAECASDELIDYDFTANILSADKVLSWIKHLPEQQANVVTLKVLEGNDYKTVTTTKL